MRTKVMNTIKNINQNTGSSYFDFFYFDAVKKSLKKHELFIFTQSGVINKNSFAIKIWKIFAPKLLAL